MQSHLPTSMSQQPQDKNDDTTEVQKAPLTEEKVEEAAPAEMSEKVKLQ